MPNKLTKSSLKSEGAVKLEAEREEQEKFGSMVVMVRNVGSMENGKVREITKQEVLNKLTKSSLEFEGAVKPKDERKEQDGDGQDRRQDEERGAWTVRGKHRDQGGQG